jgi:hypothetical protein
LGNGKVEIWYTPAEWFREDVLPVAYQAVPKEWIAFQDIEVVISPIFRRSFTRIQRKGEFAENAMLRLVILPTRRCGVIGPIYEE